MEQRIGLTVLTCRNAGCWSCDLHKPEFLKGIMPLALTKAEKLILSREERRARRELRREKQRKDNIGRAAKMHAARLKMKAIFPQPSLLGRDASVFVGCSGWFYWKWRGLFYPAELLTGEWFAYYASQLHTVEINGSFYSWPTLANVQAWERQAGRRNFVYTVKSVNLSPTLRSLRIPRPWCRILGS